MAQLIQRQEHGQVRLLTLNAPDTLNAISLEMRTELRSVLSECVEDSDCRAIVLAGAGGNFSSGGQVKQAPGVEWKPDPDRTRASLAILHDIVRLIAAGPKPVACAVEGHAVGAGLSLAAACDVLVVSESVRFNSAFSRVGLMPDSGLLWTLSQRVGVSRARAIMLGGKTIRAQEALSMGLADIVTPEGGAMQVALEAGQSMANSAPLVQAAVKQGFAMGFSSLEDVLELEAEMQPKLTLSADYAEGRAAFKEKRSPVFKGA